MKGCLPISLLISLAGNVFLIGCNLIEPINRTRTPYQNPMPDQALVSQVRSIAATCGVNPARAESMTMMELLTDIKIKLNDYEQYYGECLSEDDMNTLNALLTSNKDKVIRDKIQKHDAFIKKIDGKKIVILPNTAR